MSSHGSKARNGRWALGKLGDLVEFRNGLNYDSSAQASAEGLKVIGVSNFMGRTVPDYESLERLAGFDNVDDRDLLRENDLVFVRSNGNKALIGRALFVTDLGERVGHSGFTIRARVVTDVLRPRFLASYAFSGQFREQINRLGGGTNISNLSQAILACIRLPLPALAEQDAIVEILDRADVAVRETDALIERKVAYKKALAEDLLTGHRRFPGCTLPWCEYRLGDLFVERVEMNRSDLKLLSVTGADGVVDRDSLVKRDTSSEDKSKYLRVCPGDIAYNTMRMWQGVFGLSCLEGIVSPAYTICTPRIDIILPNYVEQLFKLPHTIHNFKRYSQGLVDDTLNLKHHHFAEVKVTIPDVEEQCRISTALGQIDQEIALLRSQRDALNDQKKGLMQKLLTGEVRLKEFR